MSALDDQHENAARHGGPDASAREPIAAVTAGAAPGPLRHAQAINAFSWECVTDWQQSPPASPAGMAMGV